MDAPQFLHSRASSSFSVPHFVQYTNLVHNQNKGCVIQSLLKKVNTFGIAAPTDHHMSPLTSPDPSVYPENSHRQEVN